jgi:hypothetical protein
VESILQIAGLEHRAVGDYDRKRVDELLQEQIDWNAVNQRLETFSEKGRRFLQEALA